uniref:Odorant receptor n=1 Tax=Lutzomyia longipalpis TaxID=7200 RepID=A0A7G3AK31_LUTLO
MAVQLEEFTKNKPLIDFQISVLTFNVFSGPPKERLYIGFIGFFSLIVFLLVSTHLLNTFNGEINDNIMTSILHIMGTCLFCLKTFVGWYRRKEIHELRREIEDLLKVNETDEDLQRIVTERMKDSLKLWKLCTRWGIRLVCLCALTYAIMARFNPKIGLIMDIPYTNITSSVLKEVLHDIPSVLIISMGPIFISIELAVLFLGIPIVSEIDILENYLKVYNEKIKTTPHFMSKLIEKHCKVLRNVNLLNVTFSEMTFIQFFASIIIFLVVFLSVRKNSDQIEYYMLCVAGQMQLLPFCLLGQYIKVKTDKLSDTLYLTNWYELSLKDQKTFLIILGMAQREYGLKAAGMYEVNLNTFVKVCLINPFQFSKVFSY